MTAFTSFRINDLFLLGLLNSYTVLSNRFNGTRCNDSERRLTDVGVLQTAICGANPNSCRHATRSKAEIAVLVQQCAWTAKGQGVADIEADINARVAALYGLPSP